MAAWPLSCVVRPLDRPCDDDAPAPPPGSELCTVAGAVLCVVGVLCTLDPEPFDVPGAVVCVVGVLCGVAVACTLDAEPLDVPAAVPCGVGIEGCDGWVAAPFEGVLWPDTAPDDVELPRSACGAAGWDTWPGAPRPVSVWVPVSACGAPPKSPWPAVKPLCWPLSSPLPC